MKTYLKYIKWIKIVGEGNSKRIIAEFVSEENPKETYIAWLFLNRTKGYCSCPGFLHLNSMKRYLQYGFAGTLRCKHLLTLEFLLLHPELLDELILKHFKQGIKI